jgi:hypothetical protein
LGWAGKEAGWEVNPEIGERIQNFGVCIRTGPENRALNRQMDEMWEWSCL